MTPFEIVDIINSKKEYDRDEVVTDYNPWVINHIMSNNMDTVFFAAEMDKFLQLPKGAQFDFYYHGIPKGKRYGKWNKADKSQELLINNLCSILHINQTLAKRYAKLLSDKQKQQIIEYEGGK